MRAKAAGRCAGLSWLAVAFVVSNTTAPLAIPAGASDARATQTHVVSASAQSLAQAYLDRFYTFALSSAALNSTQARVQVSLNGATFWAEPLAVTPEGYSATLLDEAEAGKLGDIVEFKKENVRDWSFRGRNKIYYGEFQKRAKLALLSREDAAQRGNTLTQSPVPPGW